ncbi:MAG: hypothetical protein V7K32_01895 [Nostoc sp.]|uniref:hypothetical protein n=1 Tax=Nostoc sp. TaxID=1180 RepID=UPI002FF5111F
MKSLTKIFVALLLTVGITFGGFNSNAHAQSSPLAIPNISVDVNTTFDKIVNGVRFDRKYTVVVANKTGKTLERVGVYNDSSNWPLGDIDANTAVGQQFDGIPRTNSFSFASNYRVQPGKNVQLVAKFPVIGTRKVGLGSFNEDGNKPAERIWDQTGDSSDKAISNDPFQARASIKQKDGSLVWYYEIK